MKSAPKSIWVRWAAVTGTAVLVIGLAVGGWLFHSRKAHALTEKDTIVLADFTNTTGDPVFDGTLRQGLTVQLEQSPFLSLASDQRIQQTLSLMGKPPETKLTPESCAGSLPTDSGAKPSLMARLHRLAPSTV